jgi:hypothetical protein
MIACDACHREGIFRSIWDVHVDLRAMEILCSRCFIARGGGDGVCLTRHELEMFRLVAGLSGAGACRI